MKKYTINNKEVTHREWYRSNQDGIYKLFSSIDGKLEHEFTYIEGKLNGIEKVYYDNGNLEQEIPWVDGEINGIGKGFYSTGELSYVEPFVNSNIHGIVRKYYKSGKLKEEIPWVRDKPRKDLLKKENKLKRIMLIGE